MWNHFCCAIQSPNMLQEETALTWRVCSFGKILWFFWCSKDIGCHPMWPAGRRNFFCTPEEITRPSSRRLQYPTTQNKRSKRWKRVQNVQRSTYLMPPSHFPFYVMIDYADLNLLQVDLLSLWSIYFWEDALIKYSQNITSLLVSQLDCYLLLFGMVTTVLPEGRSMLSVVFQTTQKYLCLWYFKNNHCSVSLC